MQCAPCLTFLFVTHGINELETVTLIQVLIKLRSLFYLSKGWGKSLAVQGWEKLIIISIILIISLLYRLQASWEWEQLGSSFRVALNYVNSHQKSHQQLQIRLKWKYQCNSDYNVYSKKSARRMMLVKALTHEVKPFKIHSAALMFVLLQHQYNP